MKKSWRKTITAVCMGTMLFSGNVYRADSSQDLMAYTDNVLSDGSLIYYFEEVAVTLPADWQGKFEIVTTDNSAAFYHKASHEKWQEKYGQEGGGRRQTVYLVLHHTDDSAIAAEFQQMNAEIDFVKQNAYMLSKATNTDRLLSQRRYQLRNRSQRRYQPNTEEYTGSWVQIMDEFEICLLPDWEEVELDEEDKAEGAYYAAKCVDQDAVLIVMAMDLTEGYTQEEIEAERAEGNFDSMLEVAEEALKQQGYTIEKTEVIHDIPCTFFFL